MDNFSIIVKKATFLSGETKKKTKTLNLRISRQKKTTQRVSLQEHARGEMLFPFYFRSETDKIDERRLGGMGWWGPLKRGENPPSFIIHSCFRNASNKDRDNTIATLPSEFHPFPETRPPAVFVSAFAVPNDRRRLFNWRLSNNRYNIRKRNLV